MRLPVRGEAFALGSAPTRRTRVRTVHARAQGNARGFHPQRPPSMTGVRFKAALTTLASLAATTAAAQQPASPPRDSTRLSTLQQEAAASDPRQRQFQLSSSASALRVQNIDAERLPALSVNAQAQYQSAVTNIKVPIPGISIPTPSRDTYD